jgi:hypothetical protein
MRRDGVYRLARRNKTHNRRDVNASLRDAGLPKADVGSIVTPGKTSISGPVRSFAREPG